MKEFNAWFHTANEGRAPHPWQVALAATSASCEDRLVRIPTGFGKTLGVLSAWAFHRLHRQDQGWPLRLVWTLPMRVLVEQTEHEVRAFLERLGLLWEPGESHAGKVGVHVLMGGADAQDWHLYPEQAAVLVGTQDMLLSRALNRGYGAARARWPVDFGLLSQDALWVLDEVQLMDVGLATAAQLGAFRKADAARALRPSYTWAMSATLQRKWVEQSPDTGVWAAALRDHSLSDSDRQFELWRETEKPILRLDRSEGKGLAGRILADHGALKSPRPLTLVVLNTVERARELYLELRKAARKQGPRLHLLHSRFRGLDRKGWRTEVLGSGQGSRVVVATQVIEAGVDLSADLLVTEVCPWPSLVQRLGRLARRGGSGQALVLDVDRKKQSAPYDTDDLDASWDALERIQEGSPRSLEAFEKAHSDLLDGLYPYEPAHLLLREELEELFDTTPDLSGADLDISRFIRTGDERDASIFWLHVPRDEKGRALTPDPKVRPTRDGLVAVPFLQARDWLFGKGAKAEPKRLREEVHAWIWDYLEGEWRVPARTDLWPGQTVLVDSTVGGYSSETGWDPSLKGEVPPIDPKAATVQEQTDSAQDSEELSTAEWQTIGFHGGAAAQEAQSMAAALLQDASLGSLLQLAARWHDLGKAHPAFQGALRDGSRFERRDLAKAPSRSWRRGANMYRISEDEVRPGFRHELASTLALFSILERCAAPEHPSRLGSLAELFPDASRPDGRSSSVLETELLELSAEDFDLVAYLLCCHHGKVRARLHASPSDQKALSTGGMPIRGIREGDVLPAVELLGADGQFHELPEYALTLEPAELGLSPRTGRSWSERVSGVLQRHGPFTTAFLEALMRAADVRASRDQTRIDPALASQEMV